MTHPTAGLDDVVHQRSRLGILAILFTGDRVDFGYLREALNLTAGNLSRHLSMLVQARLVTIHKGYQGTRPRTWVTITRSGRRAYQDEMAVLRSLLALETATAIGDSGPATPQDSDRTTPQDSDRTTPQDSEPATPDDSEPATPQDSAPRQGGPTTSTPSARGGPAAGV